MKKNPLEVIPPGDKSDKLFKLMHEQAETEAFSPKAISNAVKKITRGGKEKPSNATFKTGSGAMDEWQKKQDERNS